MYRQIQGKRIYSQHKKDILAGIYLYRRASTKRNLAHFWGLSKKGFFAQTKRCWCFAVVLFKGPIKT